VAVAVANEEEEEQEERISTAGDNKHGSVMAVPIFLQLSRAPLPEQKHTIISKHTMQQVHVVKTR
jgi:hypothetical protein